MQVLLCVLLGFDSSLKELQAREGPGGLQLRFFSSSMTF